MGARRNGDEKELLYEFWVIESPAEGVSMGRRPAFYWAGPKTAITSVDRGQWASEREEGNVYWSKSEAATALEAVRGALARLRMDAQVHLLHVSVLR